MVSVREAIGRGCGYLKRFPFRRDFEVQVVGFTSRFVLLKILIVVCRMESGRVLNVRE